MTALNSLYGGKVAEERRALAGNVGSQLREQTVLTPLWVLDAVRAAFDDSIVLDPCAAPDPETHFAERNVVSPADGLEVPWVDRTFVNPPYKDLAEWLAKAQYRHGRLVMLIPVRPHRRWFFSSLRGATVVYLAPLAFVGHKQAFPAPLALVSWGCTIPDLGSKETYRALV